MARVLALRALGVAFAAGLMRKQDMDEGSLPWLPSPLPWRSHFASSTQSANSRAAWLVSEHSVHAGLGANAVEGLSERPSSRLVSHRHNRSTSHAHDLSVHLSGGSAVRETDGLPTYHQSISLRKGGFSTCDDKPDTCKSMCRWLKLSTRDASVKDGVEVCPLFEWQLRACEYVPPKDRARSTEDPLDCALSIMRAMVLEADVAATVDELEACIEAVPDKEQRDCHLATDLLKNEIADFREEQALRARAHDITRELDTAIAEASAALEVKSGVVEAMDLLSVALNDAEEVPGHYLTKAIHTAREYLDRLGPIVPVIDELVDSQAEGNIALDAKSAYRAEQAILRLSTAMEDAERLEIGHPLHQAEAVEDDLLEMSAAAEDLNAAIIQANSSRSTVSHMGKTLVRLQRAIDVCKEIGVLERVPEGEQTFQALLSIKNVYSSVKTAIEQGEVALASGEGRQEGMMALRVSIEAAHAADVRRDLPVATDVLHELMHQEAEMSRQRSSGGQVEDRPDNNAL